MLAGGSGTTPVVPVTPVTPPDPDPVDPDKCGIPGICGNPDTPIVDPSDAPAPVSNLGTVGASTELVSAINNLVTEVYEGPGSATGLQVSQIGQSGVSTGGAAANNDASAGKRKPFSVWARAYGTHTNQEAYDGYDGYRSNMGGLLLAMDRSKAMGPNSVLSIGGALGYSSNHTNGISNVAGGNPSTIDVDGYQLAGYVTQLTDKYFLLGILGYSFNKFETERMDNLGQTFKSEFDGGHAFLNLKGTYDFMKSGAWTLSGIAQTTFNHLTYDEMVENDLSSGGYKVAIDDHNIWTAALGAKLKYDIISDANRVFQPEIHGRVYYDILGDRFNMEVSNTNLIPTATEGAKPDRLSYNIGAGLTMYGIWGVNLTLNYDYTWREHADEHNVSLKARYRF
ncbi:hypothetical protein BGC07_10950 [Piscirickettsia litoralis]|uniref:Autotransporter domain-containing protein n=1 Tax=Piscirickettsia litoralis TaxID=1891921 RepID=A0ABX3AB36_9GAMM|nr:hypothetical protein BGC07_10950 [Piscirickettsia litoralis]